MTIAVIAVTASVVAVASNGVAYKYITDYCMQYLVLLNYCITPQTIADDAVTTVTIAESKAMVVSSCGVQ